MGCHTACVTRIDLHSLGKASVDSDRRLASARLQLCRRVAVVILLVGVKCRNLEHRVERESGAKDLFSTRDISYLSHPSLVVRHGDFDPDLCGLHGGLQSSFHMGATTHSLTFGSADCVHVVHSIGRGGSQCLLARYPNGATARLSVVDVCLACFLSSESGARQMEDALLFEPDDADHREFPQLGQRKGA